jgi:glycosyltransferase involved in cell wall biosynthesis
MKRIFICAPVKFPRGSAAANYVEYIALALHDIGFEVYVLAINNVDGEQMYHGIHFVPFYYRKRKGIRVIDYLTLGCRTKNYLRKKGLSKEDGIVFYTDNPIYMKSVIALMQKRRCIGCACVVEWFQPFQFKGGKRNPEYRLIDHCFRKYYTKVGNIIAISTLLESEFKKRGCHTVCIPIMANVDEFPFVRQEHSKIEFLISGAADNKDSFDVMLQAFNLLSAEELENIHINVTGMSQEKFELYKKECRPETLRHITVHKWMEYEALVKLYQTIDYLILARPDNLVTRANFPSKIPEVMTYGIIPIVSKVGDYTKYYLDETNSIIIEEDTVESCAEAIKKAIHIPKAEREQFLSNARKTAVDKFHYKIWEERLENYITTIKRKDIKGKKL